MCNIYVYIRRMRLVVRKKRKTSHNSVAFTIKFQISVKFPSNANK